ncbi:MAG: hypothetical protein EOM80_16525 [Erysipelotrichia bacterium]|nr:hypothetical protein [Erysipelotrichia bacterium]
MLLCKFFDSLLGLLYVWFFYQSLSSGARNGWVFRTVSSSRVFSFYPALINDIFVALAFFRVSFFETSFVYGRTAMLLIAHTAATGAFVARFVNDEGADFGWVGRPFCFLVSVGCYYMAIIEGISLADIAETILDA